MANIRKRYDLDGFLAEPAGQSYTTRSEYYIAYIQWLIKNNLYTVPAHQLLEIIWEINQRVLGRTTELTQTANDNINKNLTAYVKTVPMQSHLSFQHWVYTFMIGLCFVVAGVACSLLGISAMYTKVIILMGSIMVGMGAMGALIKFLNRPPSTDALATTLANTCPEAVDESKELYSATLHCLRYQALPEADLHDNGPKNTLLEVNVADVDKQLSKMHRGRP